MERRTCPHSHLFGACQQIRRVYAEGVKLALLILSCLSLNAAGKDLVVPDFSQGLPGAQLEKTQESGNQVVFYFQTGLSEKKFSAILKKQLGSAWRIQKLRQEDMILAARKGRATGSVVNLTTYRNLTDKSVYIRVIHLKPKNSTDGRVEVAVIQGEENPNDTERK